MLHNQIKMAHKQLATGSCEGAIGLQVKQQPS